MIYAVGTWKPTQTAQDESLGGSKLQEIAVAKIECDPTKSYNTIDTELTFPFSTSAHL